MIKYVEAMFVPSGPVDECGDAGAYLGDDAFARLVDAIYLAPIGTPSSDAENEARNIHIKKLALDIVDISNEEIHIDEHHAEIDSDRDGSFSPLDGLGSIQHKLMLAGVLSGELVAIVRLLDLQALIAERDRLAAQMEITGAPV